MNNNELIADKLEEIIRGMFDHFRSLDCGATEFSIFHDPAKHSAWFILIFFADKNRLKEGLSNGVCYQIHTYLLNKVGDVSEISNIEKLVLFESGNRPIDKIAVDNLFESLLNKQLYLKKDNKGHIEECRICGHDFNKHQLLCNLNEDNSAPVEGWITCPEEDCNCFQTWSANYKTANPS